VGREREESRAVKGSEGVMGWIEKWGGVLRRRKVMSWGM